MDRVRFFQVYGKIMIKYRGTDQYHSIDEEIFIINFY